MSLGNENDVIIPGTTGIITAAKMKQISLILMK